MHNLSDEDPCARWIDEPRTYQLFCGEEFLPATKLTFDSLVADALAAELDAA